MNSEDWISAVEEKGHTLVRDKYGVRLDYFEVPGHNGPGCEICGVSWCMYCTPADEVDPCDCGLARRLRDERVDMEQLTLYARLLFAHIHPTSQFRLLSPAGQEEWIKRARQARQILRDQDATEEKNRGN